VVTLGKINSERVKRYKKFGGKIKYERDREKGRYISLPNGREY
jgi:hypothetical protein